MPAGGFVIDINRLLQRLCDADIDFVIVGGFAATLHGSALVTRDLDVCAILSSANVEKLRNALHDLKPMHRLTPQNISFLWQLKSFARSAKNKNRIWNWSEIGIR